MPVLTLKNISIGLNANSFRKNPKLVWKDELDHLKNFAQRWRSMHSHPSRNCQFFKAISAHFIGSHYLQNGFNIHFWLIFRQLYIFRQRILSKITYWSFKNTTLRGMRTIICRYQWTFFSQIKGCPHWGQLFGFLIIVYPYQGYLLRTF